MKKIIALFTGIFFSLSAFAQWDTLHTLTNYVFHNCFFLNADTGYVVGGDPANYLDETYGSNNSGVGLWTINGGTSWKQIHLEVTGTIPEVNDVFFSSTHKGWLACNGGYLLHSLNPVGNVYSDSSFFINRYFGSFNLNTVFFTNDSTGYVAGNDGYLFRTTNEGINWDTLHSGTNLAIRDMKFTDAAHGFIVGDGGYIATTSDSGNTWTQITQPFLGFMDANGFAFNTSETSAIIVGNYGHALFSSDAGANWSGFATGTNDTLNKVAFGTDLGVVIVGDSGIILRSEDGGTNWVRDIVPGVSQDLNGVCWATNSIAYLCGENGKVLKSNTDISSINSVAVNPIHAAAFPNPFENELNIAVDLENSSPVKIEMMDVSGRILLDENEGENFSGKNIFHLNGISSLATGMYFVRVITENGITTLPIIKN